MCLLLWVSLPNPPVKAGHVSSIPGLRRSPGRRNGDLLTYFCPKNPMDRSAWWARVHEVTKSQTQLSHWALTHVFLFCCAHILYLFSHFQEIKLPTSAGSSKKQESYRKTSISALLTMPKLLTVWITINWKILKEMRIPDHMTCLLRNLYAGQEATVRTGHGTADWFQIGKGVRQGCILSPCLFNLYAEDIMKNARCAGWSTSWNQGCQEIYQ